MTFKTENNIYYNNNPTLFMQLVQLVQDYPFSYFRILRKDGHYTSHGKLKYKKELDHSELMKWIDDNLPLLQEPCYNNATKCYWILNGLTDFPICPTCKKKEGFIHKNITRKGYFTYCSVKCMANSPEISAQKKKVCLEKFGATCYLGTKECVQRTKASKFEKYGDPNFVNVEKARQTRNKKYGKWESDQTTKHRKATNLERYGAQNVFGSRQIIDRMRSKFFEKHGVEFALQLPEKVQSGIQTKIQRYGSASVSFSYKYEGILFDSMPEIAFYIWLQDSRKKFTFHPNAPFEYFFEGKKHLYVPDFEVEGKYFEIKGDMFFENKDPTKRMICPWNHDEDNLYEAKHQCMLANKVTIMTYKDYKRYIDYCNDKFGDADWHLKYRTRKGKFFKLCS